MKNISKKIVAGLCSAALAAGMMSMVSFAEPETAAMKSYEATSDSVKLIGRTYRYNDDSTWIINSASGVEFKCTGTSVRFNLRQSGDPTRVAVYVNGKLSKLGYIKANAKKPVIDVELEDGENTVKLIKLSESAQSVIAIDSIEVDGDAPVPTAAKAHSVEFIGDSITCGYGADGSLKESFSTKNENAAKTYAYLTAQNLDLDYSFFSRSGTGIISGYTNGASKQENNLMPPDYGKVCFTWNWIDGVCPADYEWDFSQYQPELVVINLGTNDNSYTKGDPDKCAEFTEGYVAFIKQVRENNPDATILCTLGIMGQELYPQIEDAVAAYTEETGDTKVASFMFSQQDGNTNGFGSDYHPSEQSHIEASEELTAKISELMGWETVDVTETGMAGTDKANDLIFEDLPATDDPSSSEADPSSSESSSETSSDGSSSSSAASSSSSKASSSSSKAAASSTTSNPSTGAATGLAAIAVLCGAIVTTKRRK